LDLPLDFELSLKCDATDDGVRRMSPLQDVGSFILKASLAGQAIIEAHQGLSSEQRFSYAAMRLFAQHTHHLRECFGRSFAREGDLYLIKAIRAGLPYPDILPDLIGMDARGNGQRWSVGALLRIGREAARDAQCDTNDDATCIRFGIHAAARLNPLDPDEMTPEELRRLIRFVLFDLSPANQEISQVVKQRVEGRILAALERHIDDTTEDFDEWFFVKRDNLTHQVAKQKKGGGCIDRTIVRSVQLEMVIKANEYVADCLDSAMRAFAAALPVPLRRDERNVFESLYFKCRQLGGFPLVMLHQRFPQLKEVVAEILGNRKTNRAFGTLLRTLQFYAEMTQKRREADRCYANAALHRNQNGRPALTGTQDVDDLACTEADPHFFQEIAMCLRERRGAKCICNSHLHWHATLNSIRKSLVDVSDVCSTCGHNEKFFVDLQDLRKIAEQAGFRTDD